MYISAPFIDYKVDVQGCRIKRFDGADGFCHSTFVVRSEDGLCASLHYLRITHISHSQRPPFKEVLDTVFVVLKDKFCAKPLI
jgi:hypothetical protein